MQHSATANAKQPAFKPLANDYLATETYAPDDLLNGLIKRLNLKNDASLSRVLEVAPPVISKLRHRRLPITAALLVRMHDMTGLPINELRKLAGIPVPSKSA